MKIKVLINGHIEEPLHPAGLKQLAEQVLTAQGIDPDAELSLVITDQETIKKLNKTTFGKDVPTDVLAFPFVPRSRPPSPMAPPNPTWTLGKVVVSYPEAVAQSKTCCQSVEKELAHLITRGTLKLLGYNENDKQCADKEQSILGCLDVK